MEKKDLLNDKFISDLVKRSSPDSPSEDFLSEVMTQVEAMPAYNLKRKPFHLYFKTILPWVLLGGLCILVLSTSDLPYTSYIPGADYFRGVLGPSLIESFSSFSQLFSNRFFSITIAVVAAGMVLFGLERLFNRRSVRQQYLF